MKINKIYLVCLITAALLLGSVFIAQAVGYGFVSYEDGNKIILWDNVRLVGAGLRMSNLGINDLKYVFSGDIDVSNKDLYLRGFIGFNCPNYPSQFNCNTFIGDFPGPLFLKIDTLSGQNLVLNSLNSGINLQGTEGSHIQVEGKIMMTGICATGSKVGQDCNADTDCNGAICQIKGLVVSDSITSGISKSVIVQNLKTNFITNGTEQTLKIAPLFFSHTAAGTDAFFNLRRKVKYTLP